MSSTAVALSRDWGQDRVEEVEVWDEAWVRGQVLGGRDTDREQVDPDPVLTDRSQCLGSGSGRGPEYQLRATLGCRSS